MTQTAWAIFIALAMLFGACQRDVAPPESPPATKPRNSVATATATVNVTATAAPLPPPLEMGLVDSKGYIRVPNWDDRHLTPEEKKANPVINPRWAPLARCLQTSGVSPGAPAEAFGQSDLESLIGRLNAGGPLVANEGGRLAVRHSRETDAFVSCATTTLQVFSEDLYKILTPAELRAAQAAGDAPKDSPSAQAR